MNANLMATDRVLYMTWNVGFRSIICESDSQSTLFLLEDDHPLTHPYAPLAFHIKRFLSYDWDLSFTHTLCEGNACADWFGKHGASSMQTDVLL